MATKLHHYVPQFYLEGFADLKNPINTWVYEKGREGPRSQGIKGTAAEGYYYSLETPEGGKDDAIERELLSRVETKAAPIIGRWRQARKPEIHPEDIEAVAPFLATCWVRSPRMRQDINEAMILLARRILEQFTQDETLIDDFLREHPNFGASKQELQEAAKAGQDPTRILLKASKNLLIGLSFLMTDELWPFLAERKWSILEAARSVEFITSDSPLSVFELTRRGTAIIGVGIGRPGAELTLPLTPCRALRLSLKEKKVWRRISSGETREINRRIACQAERYVYASRNSKRIIAVVKKFEHTRNRQRIDPAFIEAMARKMLSKTS
jgi:hypothetical protein